MTHYARETMKAWHHLWHSLGATESQIQCLILQKLQALCIISEKKWWNDMEFLAHLLKSGRIEHTTITVRVLPNEPLRLCFMGMEPSLDPDVTCDVQMSKNALPDLQCLRTTWGRCSLSGNHESMASPVAQPGCHGKSNPMPYPT